MKPALIALCLLLAGCATQPPVAKPAWAGKLNNACLPEAAAMVEGLREHNIKSKVVVFNYSGMKAHAIAVYMYPTGTNQLWGWDSTWASIRLRAYWGDNTGIAKQFGERTGMVGVWLAGELTQEDLP